MNSKVISTTALIWAICLTSLFAAKVKTAFFQEDFLNQCTPIAMQEMQRTGIPASIKMAQAIVETNWGRSSMAVTYNNYFGIKANNNWDGAIFFQYDDEYLADSTYIPSTFRAYNSLQESFSDHSNFLKSNRRYQLLFDLDKRDYISWAVNLQSCGYATDPGYASKLIDVIEKFELYKLDEKEGITKEHTPLEPAAALTKEEAQQKNNANVKPIIIPQKEEEELITPYILPENYQRGDGFKRNEINTKVNKIQENSQKWEIKGGGAAITPKAKGSKIVSQEMVRSAENVYLTTKTAVAKN